jgi:signal peptidase I
MFEADARSSGTMPERGDLVVFHYPPSPSTDYVKRVIGLPGEHIQLRRGIHYINGTAVPRTPAGQFVANDNGVSQFLGRYTEVLPNGRSYAIVKATDNGMMNNTEEYLVPPDTFFVFGDNRDNSADSRILNGVGYVPARDFVATAWTIFWSRDFSRLFGRVQ